MHESVQPLSKDLFALRKNLIFAVSASSREAHESFCFSCPDMVTEMDCFLQSTRGLQSFFDVGSFHGVFSMGFASQNKGGRVIALEPSPDAFKLLSHNCSLNAEYEIVPLMSAAGSQNGFIQMAREWEHFVVTSNLNSDSCADVFEVPVFRLDDIAIRHDCWPQAIKIDVEGFEAEVLAGAPKCLEQCIVLHLEMHPEPLASRGADPLAILKQLANMGFIVRTPEGHVLDLNRCVLPAATFRVALSKANTHL